MGFSLSTSWNAYRYVNGKDLVFEIKSLGFGEIELSFNLTPEMVKDIGGLVASGSIKVSSVHNFCPIPDGVKRELALPDYYSVASLKDEEREKAVKQTKASIETAASLGARAVVLHCGRVEVPDRTRKLMDIYSAGLSGSREFLLLRDEIIAERKARVAPHFENTLRSLEELNAHAVRFGVMLGVETRFYYREIPSFEETGVILDKFRGSNIYYWHDTGHGRVMENLGFCSRNSFLEAYSENMAGIHLHDVSACDDHRAPLKGEFDFNGLKPFIKKDTLKVIEAHHPASPQDLKEAVQYLEGLFDGKA